MSKRIALIVANGEFRDPKLNGLVKPGRDAEALADVLSDPEIGGFEVNTLVDEKTQRLRRQIARLYNDRRRGDLLVLYYSGHGIRDQQTGDLYLATRDTETDIPSATAIEAAYVQRLLDKSNSQRKVVILDCCYAGAFARGAKAAPGGSVGTEDIFGGSGFGRVILTASNALQYAWEGDRILGDARPSVFTHYLVEGLRAGAADRNGDGAISLNELYDYVHEKVVTSGEGQQTPQKWEQKVEGQLTIAKNPHPVIKPAELPTELLESIRDMRSWVREGAANKLIRLVHGEDRGIALAALQALQRMSKDDSQRVRGFVARTLEEISEAQSAAGAGSEGPAAAIDAERLQPLGAELPPEAERKKASGTDSRAGLKEGLQAEDEGKSPEKAEVEDRRGRQLVDSGDYQRALPFFSRAIDLDPEAEYFFHRGWCYLRLADYGRGIDDLDRAIELDKDNAEYYCLRGTAHHWSEDLDLAVEDLGRAIELSPGDAELHYRSGLVYADRGEHDRSIADLSRAIELDPVPEYYFRRGLVRKTIGDTTASRADLSHAAHLGHQLAEEQLKDL